MFLMDKNVLISKKLFNALCRYFIFGDESEHNFIKHELEIKANKNAKRVLYKQYLTADGEKEKEIALSAYKHLQNR